jgi:hypothetical protein
MKIEKCASFYDDETRIPELFDAVRAQTPQEMDERKRLVKTLYEVRYAIFVYAPPGIRMPAFDLIELVRAPRGVRLAIQTAALEVLVSHSPPNKEAMTYKEIEKAMFERCPGHEKALAEMGDYERDLYTDLMWPARKCFDASFPLKKDPQSMFTEGHRCIGKIFEESIA